MSSRGSLPWFLAVALLLGLVGFVLVRSLPTAVYTTAADDSYYLHYARTVAEQGVWAFPGLYEWRNGVEARWIHPPPSRLGYVVPAALWLKAFGASAVSLSTFSIAAHVLTTFVAFLLGRRRRGDAFGVAFALLVGFAPLLLGLGRLALMDSYTTLCSFACVWAFLEWLEAPRSNARTVLFAASLGWLVLTKELAVLVVAPFAVSLVLERALFRRDVPWARVALAFVIPGAIVPLLLVGSAGGVAPLVETARTIVESPRTNQYTLAYCAGPWYRYLVDFMLLAPLPTLLGLAGVVHALMQAREGRGDRFLVHLAALFVVTLLANAFVMKNARYATLLELPLRALAVAMVAAFVPATRRNAWMLGVVVVLAFLDWRSFVLFWETKRGYDPVSAFLLGVRGFLPTAGQ